MDLLKLLSDRTAGWVKITFTKNYNYDLKDVMARVGLHQEPSALRKIDQEEAINTLTQLLWRDSAYSHEMIDKDQARTSASAFIHEYSMQGAEFYDNLEWYADSPAWSPLSASTFDRCLLIVNADSAICVLAEDED